MTETIKRFAGKDRQSAAVALTLAALVGLGTAAASATSVPTGKGDGRFVMTPTDNGLMRLDTRTGQMALCAKADEGWACKSVTDQTAEARNRVANLEKENAELKNKVTQLEEMLMAFRDRPEGSTVPSPLPSPNSNSMFKLPSQKQVDQAFDYFENMLRKFLERLKRLGQSPEDRGERTL